MKPEAREARVVETFATLADTLVDTYDVVDLLQTLVETCTDVLGIADAGIVLVGPTGDLDVVASTSEDTRLIEALQVNASAGPCMTCLQTGRPVVCADIETAPEDWSVFRSAALDRGFRSVHAVPMRLRETVIGTLNLFGSMPGELQADDLRIAQALADVATIGILHERALREQEVLHEQLQRTLDARVRIEQAKGVVSYTRGVSMEAAYDVLRAHAVASGSPLSEVARAVVHRELTL